MQYLPTAVMSKVDCFQMFVIFLDKISRGLHRGIWLSIKMQEISHSKLVFVMQYFLIVA